MLSASIVLPTRNVAYAMAFDRSFPQSLASLYIADSEHFLAEAPLLSASAKKRFGIRVERLPPPSPLSLSPTPLLRHGVGPLSLRLRQQTLFDGYVLAFAATPPLSGCWHASLRCQPETSACYSDPEGQASSLRPPIGALPPSATILPPIRGLMNARRFSRGTRSFLALSGSVDLSPKAGM